MYFEYFQYNGGMLKANIELDCFSFDNQRDLKNERCKVCYRWRHMYHLQGSNPVRLKQVEIRLTSETIPTSES